MDAPAMFAEMLRRLETDPLWAREYEEFVRQVSLAGAGEAIDFADALGAAPELVRYSAHLVLRLIASFSLFQLGSLRLVDVESCDWVKALSQR